MPFINFEINLILTLSEKCVLSNNTKATTFAKTDTKLYVPVVTLSTIKIRVKRKVNWNKFQSKVTI